MQFDKFVAPYKEVGVDSDTYEGRQQELLETSARWSQFFDDSLVAYLDGDISLLPNVEDFVNYVTWVEHELEPELTRSTYEATTQRSSMLANLLNFHVLNRSFVPQWLQLVTHRSESSAQKADSLTQDLIAHSAVTRLQKRDKVPVEDYYDRSPANMLRRRTYEGILTEYDTALALLEISKTNPNHIVLPATQSFEHSRNGALNVDFVYIDTDAREVIGVQTKSNVRKADMEKYDSDRVVLVDGNVDFGNFGIRQGKLDAGRPTAGLLAAEQIQHVHTHGKKRSVLNDLLPQSELTILQAKFFMDKVIPRNQNSRKKAAQNISRRVLTKLYQDHATQAQIEKHSA